MIEINRVEPDEASVGPLFEFILPMAEEVAMTEVTVSNAFENCYRTIADGSTFIAKDGDEIVGSLGFAKNAYWYGDGEDYFLIDRWFYVRPDRRFGDVGVKLLRAGRDEGKLLMKNVFVMIANPDRKKKSNEAGIYATVAGYTPFVHMLNLHRVKVAGSA